MPTILRIGPYRFYSFSHEGLEPSHVHEALKLHQLKKILRTAKIHLKIREFSGYLL